MARHEVESVEALREQRLRRTVRGWSTYSEGGMFYVAFTSDEGAVPYEEWRVGFATCAARDAAWHEFTGEHVHEEEG